MDAAPDAAEPLETTYCRHTMRGMTIVDEYDATTDIAEECRKKLDVSRGGERPTVAAEPEATAGGNGGDDVASAARTADLDDGGLASFPPRASDGVILNRRASER